MHQITVEIHRLQDLEELAQNKTIARYREESRTVYANLYISRMTKEQVRGICERLRSVFPGILITGQTIFGSEQLNASRFARTSFYFFGDSDVRTFVYDLTRMSLDDAIREFRAGLDALPDLRAVQLLPYGMTLNVSRLVEEVSQGFESIPFVGTVASNNLLDLPDGPQPFVFCNDTFLDRGFAAVAVCGADLSAYADYRLGWKPMGRGLPATVDEAMQRPIGDTTLVLADDIPAAQIYQRYLGIAPDQYLFSNIMEFPVMVVRNGVPLVRIPFAMGEHKELFFYGDIRQGENVRLGYGNPGDLIAEAEKGAGHMRIFEPQALQLFVCVSRYMLNKDRESNEIHAYQRVMNDLTYCQGAGEIYAYEELGGLANGALVAFGLREGDRNVTKPAHSEESENHFTAEHIVPFDERLIRFLQATTSELNSMAAKAEAANEAKSAFLSNMSHEIRTPINAVLGMDEMILRESTDPQTVQYAQNIKSAGETLLSLVNDILDFSKIEAGKLSIVPVDYDTRELFADLYVLVNKRAQDKGLEMIFELDPLIPVSLKGDVVRIKQVLLNLLTNSIKYTDSGFVKLWVGLEHPDGKPGKIALRVRVSDSGIGMREEEMPKLFRAFERIDEKRNSSVEGTGLGMNITQQLLNLMGSSVGALSIYGVGSIFYFDLEQDVLDERPIGDFTFRLSLPSKRDDYHVSFHAENTRILAVDDAPMNLQVVTGLLKETGITVDTAASGQECLHKLADPANEYDLILLDQRMPVMDGIQTLHELRALHAGNLDTVPVICLTANALTGAREEYLKAGFDDYLTKPIAAVKLEEMVAAHLPQEKVTYESVRSRIPDGAGMEPVSGAVPDFGSMPGAGAIPAVGAMPGIPPVPPKLFYIRELDVPTGFQNVGNGKNLVDALMLYKDSLPDNLDEIHSLFAKDDLANFTIRVHALKSTSRMVGIYSAGKLAELLEKAGDEEDRETIRFYLPHLERVCRDVHSQLEDALSEESMRQFFGMLQGAGGLAAGPGQPGKMPPGAGTPGSMGAVPFGAGAGNAAGAGPGPGLAAENCVSEGISGNSVPADKPPLTDGEFQEALSSIRELAESYDYDSIQFVLESLNGFAIPKELEPKLKEVWQAVKAADWDRIRGC